MADELTNQQLFQQAVAEAEPPKAPEPEPQPVAAEPELPLGVPPAEPPAPKEEAIPPWRLREESEARRAAERHAQLLEHRVQQMEGHLRQAAGQEKGPDFFANPDEAVNAAVMKVVAPYAEATRTALMGMSKMVACSIHTEEAVDKAEAEFMAAIRDQTLDPVEYEAVVQNPNRYDAVVKWSKRRATLSTVGADPNAWFEQELTRRMTDPNFQARVLGGVREGAAARPGETRIPPSLSRIPSAAPTADALGGMSHAELFNFAKPER